MLVTKLISLLALVPFALGSDVVDLTPANFDKIIDGSRPALVEFFAPWCGHCKSLAPTYEEVASAYAKNKDSIVIAKVDADQHKSLGTRFGVQGFPTLKWFGKGDKKGETYNGGREADDFYKFIEEKTGIKSSVKRVPSAVKVLTSSNFDDTVKAPGKNVLAAFTAPWCGHCKSLKPVFEKVAKTFANEPNCVVANIDATVSTDLASKYDVQGYPTIKFFKADGDKTNPDTYELGRDEQSFVDYLNERCGTFRVPGGGLNSKAGRLAELDALAAQYVKASATERATLLAQAKTLGGDAQHGKYGKYYAKVMERINKADGFPAKETARLTKILENGSTTADKADDFYVRRNILAVFAAGSSAGADKQEL